MTWSELITRLLTLGKSREEIAAVIREMAEVGEISQAEAAARVDLLDRLANLQKQPVMIIHTGTESIYEVDTKNKRVRRMTGARNPTPRQGKDGEWRDYTSISPDPPSVGNRLLIVWDSKTTPLLEGSAEGDVPTTMTSVVMKINPLLS